MNGLCSRCLMLRYNRLLAFSGTLRSQTSLSRDWVDVLGLQNCCKVVPTYPYSLNWVFIQFQCPLISVAIRTSVAYTLFLYC